MRELNSEDLSGICPDEWAYATQLLDLLEEKTGAYAVPIISKQSDDGLIGFALYANGHIICASPYFPDCDPAESVDILGYLFFYVFGHTEGEA
jgi:hypothetical protein